MINFKDPTIGEDGLLQFDANEVRYFMGKIRINLPNESVIVTIAGDTPTVAEQLKLINL